MARGYVRRLARTKNAERVAARCRRCWVLGE
jgi:hypothetical protein